MSEVIFVGEDNPQSTDPDMVLHNWPPGCAGHRLQEILDLTNGEYESLHRTNLCNPAWDIKLARAAAFDLLCSRHTMIVALGRKVTDAIAWAVRHDYHAHPGFYLETFSARDACGVTIVSLPHPSGRNHVWNDPASAVRARKLLATATRTRGAV